MLTSDFELSNYTKSYENRRRPHRIAHNFKYNIGIRDGRFHVKLGYDAQSFGVRLRAMIRPSESSGTQLSCNMF